VIPASHISPRAYRVLIDYLRNEINRALGERRPLEEKWLRYQRMYKAQPERQVKEFPFTGAANLVLPVGATDTDTIYSRLMGILYGPENLWSCSPLREDAVEYAPRLQEFLKWAQRAELNTYPAVADWLLELCKLGTAVQKQRYKRESRMVYEFRETMMGPMERFARVMVKDNPVLEHVSLYDFLVPAGTIELQDAPWCSERIMLTWQQIEQRARAGVYGNVDRLANWQARDKGSWLRQEIDKMGHFVPGLPNRMEVWESWLDFDIAESGEPMSLVVTLHLPTMTPLRLDYNPFFHQEKPFEVARYLRQEKQFYGIGIMEMLEMFQEETTAMHNQRIDNATLANSVMMKARKNIGIKEDEPIYPGRWFLLDDLNDVQTMQFGRGFDATIQDENLTMSYASRRTGVNDYVMGNQSAAIGYATAQTNIMQHQEAAKRFDQTLREVRVALGNSGRRIVELYQQFNSQGKEYTVLGPNDGEIVHQILQFPLELIRHSVSVDVTATSASLNKEVQIRTNTILMQLVTQYYQQAFEGMSLAMNPQLPPPLRMLAQQMVIGGAVMMKRVLDSYDMQDVNVIIPDIREIVYGQSQQLEQLGGPPAGIWPQGVDPQQAAYAGGGAGAAGLLQSPGMGPGTAWAA
jgi:hypothetical protein